VVAALPVAHGREVQAESVVGIAAAAKVVEIRRQC